MIRYLLCLLSIYALGWTLMLLVGIADAVWGIGTIGYWDAVAASMCIVGFILAMALCVGSLSSLMKDAPES